jgi:exosortase/archaeosortase family protein
MRRRRFVVFSMLAVAVVVAFGGFYLLTDPTRRLEGWLVMGLMRPVGSRASIVNETFFQLLPPGQEPFRAQLTPFCSSLIPILALACIGFFVLHGTWARRLMSVAAATALVLLCNVVRIAGSLWAGYEWGGTAMVLFHDWVGTFFALVYTMAGFFLMLYLLLPSATAQIPRAARVSDVL